MLLHREHPAYRPVFSPLPACPFQKRVCGPKLLVEVRPLHRQQHSSSWGTEHTALGAAWDPAGRERLLCPSRTPLHCAASCNSVHLCKQLVESGAAIFASTISDVETAADKCEEAEEGYSQCSQFLRGVGRAAGVPQGGGL